MTKKLRNGYYDESYGRWVFHSIYDFDKFEKELRAHFSDGGLNKKTVIAGVLGVSYQTVSHWMNPDHKNYRDEFHALVERLAPKAHAKTDERHRDLAYGRLVDGNAAAMNRRASHILGMTEKVETRQEIKKDNSDLSIEDLNTEIERLEGLIKESENE